MPARWMNKEEMIEKLKSFKDSKAFFNADKPAVASASAVTPTSPTKSAPLLSIKKSKQFFSCGKSCTCVDDDDNENSEASQKEIENEFELCDKKHICQLCLVEDVSLAC